MKKKQKFYYHNPKTNKVSWVHPKLLEENKDVLKKIIPKPLKFGFANKVKLKGIAKLQQIRFRYFVLWTDGELEYYEIPDKKKEDEKKELEEVKRGYFKGSINISKVNFQKILKPKESKYYIEFDIPDNLFYISYQNVLEMETWVDYYEDVGSKIFDELIPVTLTQHQKKAQEERKKVAKKLNEESAKRILGRLEEYSRIEAKNIVFTNRCEGDRRNKEENYKYDEGKQ